MTWKIFPIDPNRLRTEEERIRKSFWLAEEKPFLTLVAAILNVGSVSYAEYRILHWIQPFDTNHWFGSLTAGLAIMVFGGILGALVLSMVILKLISGLVRAFTGKGMFSIQDSYGRRWTRREGHLSVAQCSWASRLDW